MSFCSCEADQITDNIVPTNLDECIKQKCIWRDAYSIKTYNSKLIIVLIIIMALLVIFIVVYQIFFRKVI